MKVHPPQFPFRHKKIPPTLAGMRLLLKSVAQNLNNPAPPLEREPHTHMKHGSISYAPCSDPAAYQDGTCLADTQGDRQRSAIAPFSVQPQRDDGKGVAHLCTSTTHPVRDLKEPRTAWHSSKFRPAPSAAFMQGCILFRRRTYGSQVRLSDPRRPAPTVPPSWHPST